VHDPAYSNFSAQWEGCDTVSNGICTATINGDTTIRAIAIEG